MTESYRIIDSHCHLNSPVFDADREQVIQRARKAGVIGFVIAGTTRSSWPGLLQISAEKPYLFAALGLHPYFLDQHLPGDVDDLREAASHARPVAIGEIGLDFFLKDLDRNKQIELLEAQLEVARALDLPVILHVRKAHEQTLAILKKKPVKGGICHAFNGSLQQAGIYEKLGFRLGFGGMLTYQRATRLRTLAARLPLEQIVLESDAPDMPGAGHQQQRNSPEYLPEVLATLAEIRTEDTAQIARQTTRNVMRVLDFQG